MKKIYLILILGMFLINLASASFGTFKQGQEVRLLQTCSDCAFNNISSVVAPDGSQLVGNVLMTKNGNAYNYTLSGSLTAQIGTYAVNGFGDPSGTTEVWLYHFDVKGGNLGFFILGFVLFFGLMAYGIYLKNPWISLIGCFGIVILGIYTSFNGIDLYKNDLTKVISYVTIAIGLGVGFQALREITFF